MRVLFLLHQFLPRHVTGTEQYARSLARELRRRGHDTRVFAYEPLIQHAAPGRFWFEQDEVVDGIPVRRASVHPLASPNPVLLDYENPLAVRLLRRYLDVERFDLAHVFHPRNVGAGALDEFCAVGLPFVVSLMDFWFLCPNNLLLRRDGSLCQGPPEGGLGCVGCLDPELGAFVQETGVRSALAVLGRQSPGLVGFSGERMPRALALLLRKERLFSALGRADAVLSPSRFVQATFAAAGFDHRRIQHVPYGIDRSRFGDHARQPRPEGQRLRLGYIGSITPHKGLHTLIPVLRRLRDPRWTLLVHGSLDTHPEYAAQVRALAGKDRRIRFRGAFGSDRLGEVLASLDAVVVPSLWYENTPFTILEALAFGLPVLASDLGGISEIVVHGSNGLLFRPGDPASMGDALARLQREPRALPVADARVQPRTLGENVDELESIYRSVLTARAARSA
jgi:glycosyltransferase involved in cell wall biosynthesis